MGVLVVRDRGICVVLLEICFGIVFLDDYYFFFWGLVLDCM